MERCAEWGLFCNPDRQHAFVPHYIIKLCAIQQGSKTPHIELSPDIKPNNEKKLGLGMGFDELLSKWASNKALVSISLYVECAQVLLYMLNAHKCCLCSEDDQVLAVPRSGRSKGSPT